MNNTHDVYQLRCKSILVWLEKSGDCIGMRTNEPYNSAVEIEDAQAIQLANILISLVRLHRDKPIVPTAHSCIAKRDKGFGTFYELPDERIVFWGEGGGRPLFIETKYPDNVPIYLSFQEALDFAEKLIAVAGESPK